MPTLSLPLRQLLALALVASALALAPSAVAAQTRSQFEVWFGLPMTLDIGDDVPRVQLWLDVHVRRQPNQTAHILRPGVGLRIFEWMIVHVGYAWTPTFIDSPQQVRNQHRIWEQLIINAELHPRLDFQSRTRVEQRFSEGSSDLSVRVRQLLRLGWHFSRGSPFGLVLWDELFLGLTETNWAPSAGLDQNRLFVGPSVQIPHLGRLEGGYLFVYQRRSPADTVAHVLLTQLIVVL